MPLLRVQGSTAEVGRIRLGEKRVSGTGSQYPASLETFRFTSHVKSVLEDAARVFGGDVKPWKDHPGQWELYTERKEIHVLVSGKDSLNQHYEQWIGGGWTHRCDGEQCVRRSKEGEEWAEPCSCHMSERGFPFVPDDAPKGATCCKATTRLRMMLTEINSTGMWLLTSGGKIAAAEILAHFEQCEALGLPNFLFCLLTIEQEEIKRPGEKTSKFVVPRLSIDPNPPNFLGRIVELVQNSQYVLPSSGQQALGTGTRSLGPGAAQDVKERAAQIRRDLNLSERQCEELKYRIKGALSEFLVDQVDNHGAKNYSDLLKAASREGLEAAVATPVQTSASTEEVLDAEVVTEPEQEKLL